MSSLLTQCPHCQTSFRVSRHQLEAAAGQVRCGACLGVFSARENEIRVKPAQATSLDLFADDSMPNVPPAGNPSPGHFAGTLSASGYQPGDFQVALDDEEESAPPQVRRRHDPAEEEPDTLTVSGGYDLRYDTAYIDPGDDDDIPLGDFNLAIPGESAESHAQPAGADWQVDDDETAAAPSAPGEMPPGGLADALDEEWSGEPQDDELDEALDEVLDDALMADMREAPYEPRGYQEYVEYEDPEPDTPATEDPDDIAARDTSPTSGFIAVEQYVDDLELDSWLHDDDEIEHVSPVVAESATRPAAASTSWLDDEDDFEEQSLPEPQAESHHAHSSGSWLDDDEDLFSPAPSLSAAPDDADEEPLDYHDEVAMTPAFGDEPMWADDAFELDEDDEGESGDEDEYIEEDNVGRNDAYTQVRARHAAPDLDELAAKARLRRYLSTLEDDEALGDLDPDSLDLDEEPVLLDDAPRRRGPWSGIAFGLANLALLALLGLQFISANFDAFDRSARFVPFRPLVCTLLDCPPPPTAPSNLYSQQLVVRMHPRLQDALEVSFVFHNDSLLDQDFPGLELTFRNDQDQPVASRTFLPEEYLPPELRAVPRMPAQSTIQVQLDVVDPGPAARNYSLAFHDIE